MFDVKSEVAASGVKRADEVNVKVTWILNEITQTNDLILITRLPSVALQQLAPVFHSSI